MEEDIIENISTNEIQEIGEIPKIGETTKIEELNLIQKIEKYTNMKLMDISFFIIAVFIICCICCSLVSLFRKQKPIENTEETIIKPTIVDLGQNRTMITL
jgi:uncharacterized membrane protein YukC